MFLHLGLYYILGKLLHLDFQRTPCLIAVNLEFALCMRNAGCFQGIET